VRPARRRCIRWSGWWWMECTTTRAPASAATSAIDRSLRETMLLSTAMCIANHTLVRIPIPPCSWSSDSYPRMRPHTYVLSLSLLLFYLFSLFLSISLSLSLVLALLSLSLTGSDTALSRALNSRALTHLTNHFLSHLHALLNTVLTTTSHHVYSTIVQAEGQLRRRLWSRTA
jgi:hypothetical protein